MKIVFLNRWSRFFSETVILNSCLRNRCFVSSLETVFRNSVVLKWCYRFFVKRCSQNRCREIGITSSLQKRCYEIGVTVSSLKRWSRKSVLPNLVVSNRSYEIGALVSLLKRDPNFVFLNSVFRFLHENGVPKFGDLNRCYRFFSKTVFPKSVSRLWWSKKWWYEIGVTVSSPRKRCLELRWFQNSLSQNGVSQNRCFRFFLKRWSRKLVLPNLVVPKRCHEIGVPVFFS